MDISGILFTGVFLSKLSSDALKEKLAEIPGANRFPNVFCHHVTFMFKPSLEHLSQVEFGTTVDIPMEPKIFTTDKVAFVVPMDIWRWKDYVQSGLPHITLSTAKGVSPVESLNVLESIKQNGPDSVDIKEWKTFIPALFGSIGAHHRQKGTIVTAS